MRRPDPKPHLSPDHAAVPNADFEFVFERITEGLPIPVNTDSGNHARTAATIIFYCNRVATEGGSVRSVRAIFEEGAPIFEASKIRSQSHVQIAVRDLTAILEIDLVKLVDPSPRFHGIIARRRGERAAVDADCFRFGGRAPNRRASTGPVAVVGARVDTILTYIGALGGLLADLGYDMYAVSCAGSAERRRRQPRTRRSTDFHRVHPHGAR